MAHRRPAKILNEQLVRPRHELSLTARFLVWAFRSDASIALALGALFTVGMGLGHLLPSRYSGAATTLQLLLGLLIFGVFLGVIIVTEENNNYKTPGSRIRIICGAVSFSAIAIMLSAPMEAIAFAALAGAMLGYLGIYWARYL